MATEEAKSRRRALALIGLQDAKTALANRLGIAVEESRFSKDAEISEIERIEDVANFLNSAVSGFDESKSNSEDRDRFENIALSLPPLAGLERGEDESTLDYFERWVNHFPTLVSEPTESTFFEQLLEVVDSFALAKTIVNAGYDSREKLMLVSDDDLTKLEKVGAKTVEKIRLWLGSN